MSKLEKIDPPLGISFRHTKTPTLSAPDSGKPLKADQNLLQLYSNVICLIHFDNAYTFNISVSSFKAVPSIAKYFNRKSKQQQKCLFFLNYIILCILVCFTFKMFDPYG